MKIFNDRKILNVLCAVTFLLYGIRIIFEQDYIGFTQHHHRGIVADIVGLIFFHLVYYT